MISMLTEAGKQGKGFTVDVAKKFDMQPKVMKFRGFKAEMILEGTKTSSLRLFDDKNLSVGDDLTLVNYDTREEFGHVTITEVIEKQLEDITENDLVGHEPFE